MKILFCGTRSSAQLLKLKELLSEHEIITSPHDAVADHLAGVDIIIPSGATIDSNSIKKGQFGLIQQFGSNSHYEDNSHANALLETIILAETRILSLNN